MFRQQTTIVFRESIGDSFLLPLICVYLCLIRNSENKKFLLLTTIFCPARKFASQFSGNGVLEFSIKNFTWSDKNPCCFSRLSKHSFNFCSGNGRILSDIPIDFPKQS